MARDYVFTCFETEKELEFDKDKIRYICYGREECPTTGRKHLQGFAIANRTVKIPQFQRWAGIGKSYCHKRGGSRDQARDYCRKSGGEFFEWGRFDGFTKEELFKQPIEYIKKEYPEFYCRYHKGLEKLQVRESPKWRDIEVTVLWGEPETFKSRRARDCKSWYSVETPYKWFDGYIDQKRLIIDDFEIDNIGRTKIKRLLDGYAYMMETKGGHTHAHWTEVFITTNENPKWWWSKVKGLKRRCHNVIECKETSWEEVTSYRAGGNTDPSPVP